MKRYIGVLATDQHSDFIGFVNKHLKLSFSAENKTLYIFTKYIADVNLAKMFLDCWRTCCKVNTNEDV